MAATTCHGSYPTWILYWLLFLLSPTLSPLLDPTSVLMLDLFLLGSILPDVPAEFFIWRAIYHRFKDKRDWNMRRDGLYKTVRKVATYNKRMTRDLETLRNEGSWVMHFYDFMGSILMWCGIFLISWNVFDDVYLAVSLPIGYGLHIFVDYFMHPDARPFYPLSFFNPFGCKRPWWEWKEYREPLFKVVIPKNMPIVGWRTPLIGGTVLAAPTVLHFGIFATFTGLPWLGAQNLWAFALL